MTRLIFIATLSALAAAFPQNVIIEPDIPDDTPRVGITIGGEHSKTGIIFTPVPSSTILTTALTFAPTEAKATPTATRKETTRKGTKAPTPTPVCVNGRGGVEVGNYQIDYALASTPAGFPRLGGYKISSVWEQRHQIGTMSLSLGADWADYGEFKCQYTCNSQTDCVSFAGWQVQERGRDARFECHLYDALITNDAFTLVGFDSSTYTLHAFNKFCASRPPKRRSHEPEKRDEAISSKAGSSGLRCRNNEARGDMGEVPLERGVVDPA